MKKLLKTFLFFGLLFSVSVLFIQSTNNQSVAEPIVFEPAKEAYPQNYFRLPLDVDVAISGTFGELRPNHFHSGIDYKTNQREGYPVYAVADGFVSRIRAQAAGFGFALYIDHPNGFTSAYAHLQRFNPTLANALKDMQYKNQSFEVDFFPLPIEYKVKKGDIIGYSGNSGSSQGPHLHFEIRHTQTEEPINPLLFGLSAPDTRRPSILGLYVYPMNDSSTVNNVNRRVGFQVAALGNGNYQLARAATINASGEISFGINANDLLNGAENRNGVYSIELKHNDNVIYHTAFERFSFAMTRALNSHIDYQARATAGTYIQRSYIEPGNRITLYKVPKEKGVVTLTDGKMHDFEYIVKDYAGNTSSLKFKVNASVNRTKHRKEIVSANAMIFYDRSSEYSVSNLKVIFPPFSIYNNLVLTYSAEKKPVNGFSEMHSVHNDYVPLHNFYDLHIKPDADLKNPDKALIVTDKRVSMGGEFENGWVKSKVRQFGNFYVAIDTIPPTITPVQLTGNRLVFRIRDDLSGIKSYRGTINDNWVLFEYDQKSATIKHVFDERTPSGKHTLKLVVSDNKNNIKTYETTITRP